MMNAEIYLLEKVITSNKKRKKKLREQIEQTITLNKMKKEERAIFTLNKSLNKASIESVDHTLAHHGRVERSNKDELQKRILCTK